MSTSESLTSRVEQTALAASSFALSYPPGEKARIIVVPHFPALGRLTALRFLEWVQENPEGVVSLPTGKTPEYFIRWVEHYTSRWAEADTARELEDAGIDPAIRPDMSGLHFVQIDDFYPIESSQHNSFYWYVRKYYIDGFGLDPAKALLIKCDELGLAKGETLSGIWPDGHVDLSLRYRAAHSQLEREQKRVLFQIDEWCQEYERKVRDLGGIGFFLGGIGPDGHIGFNMRGADHYSTTRLVATNYETQAAAATDLGGIEIARRRHVITIGLGTITYDSNCTAIIMAAGEAKAKVVADAIHNPPGVCHPASSLQRIEGARFYLTGGAASRLTARQVLQLERTVELSDEQIDRVLVDISLKTLKRLTELTDADLTCDDMGSVLVAKLGDRSLADVADAARSRIVKRIEKGATALTSTRFLHTEPHHDDVMLAYLPAIVRNIRDASNEHHFATLTSGFTSVTNGYLKSRIEEMLALLDTTHFRTLDADGYFDPDNVIGRNRDVWQYLDGVAASDERLRDEGAARRLVRNIRETYGLTGIDQVKATASEILAYLAGAHPGKKDPADIQQLKGMGREWEVEALWGYFGWSRTHINHLRLGFYKGDIFTEEPTEDRDVPPILDLMKRTRPDVVGVALDPEGSGPDTHYKVLQAIAAALRHLEQSGGTVPSRIWGYRNVWYRFHPAESNMYVPVSLNMFATMDNAFRNTFVSQREASFPSYEHDGPFCELAQHIQVEQYQMLKTCLGREWFHEHDSPLIRGTRGLVFIKEMDLDEFVHHSRELKRATEDR